MGKIRIMVCLSPTDPLDSACFFVLPRTPEGGDRLMAAADGWEPLPEVSKAKIMGMSFTIDGEEELTLKPTD